MCVRTHLSPVLITDPFTPRQTYQTEQYLALSGQPPATLQLMHEDYLYTHIHHCL